MHLGDKLAALHERVGQHVEVSERKRILWIIPFTRRHGWLSIQDADPWMVTWSLRRDTYDPVRDGEMITIHVRKDTGERRHQLDGITGVWRTGLPRRLRRMEHGAEQLFQRVHRLVDLAYAFHITQPWIAKPDLIPSVRG